MKTPRLFLTIGLYFGLTLALGAQAATTAPAVTTTPGETVPPAAVVLVASPGAATLAGTWKVEIGVYDYIRGLQDVTNNGPEFYQKLVFAAGNKGQIYRNGVAEPVEMEYEMRDQGLVIAYGSRLKILNDNFQLLWLADGRMLLKSRMLGNVNGKVYYILVRS